MFVDILSITKDARFYEVVAVSADGNRETLKYPATMTSAEVKAEILGKHAPAKIEPIAEDKTPDMSYSPPPESVELDTAKKDANTLTRVEMLKALNAAGKKGYQTASVDVIRNVYKKLHEVK